MRNGIGSGGGLLGNDYRVVWASSKGLSKMGHFPVGIGKIIENYLLIGWF